MKKFTEFNRFRKVNEQEITLNKKEEEQESTDNTEVVTNQPETTNVTVNIPNAIVTPTTGNVPNPVNNVVTTTNEPTTEKPAEKEEVTKSEPAKFFSKLFESREMAHMYHLQVNGDQGSYAAHNALNAYYEEVIDLIDEVVEIYQGQYDIITDYDVIDTSETKTKDKIEYFISIAQFIKDTRYTALLQEDSHLQNIVDEIVALIYKTLYKLRFNK